MMGRTPSRVPAGATLPASSASAPAAHLSPVFPAGGSALGSPGFLQEEGAQPGYQRFRGALGSHLLPLLFLTLGNKDGAAPVAPVTAPVGELVPELDLKGAVSPQGADHWSRVEGSGGGSQPPCSPALGHRRVLGGLRAEPPAGTWEVLVPQVPAG